MRLPVPPATVWADLERLETHAEWMAEAERIGFNGPRTRGVGTVMTVPTKVGPFRIDDVMEVVTWRREREIGIRHVGLVSGTGRFTLAPDGSGTRVTWTEELTFPPRLGGPVGERLAAVVLRRIWRRNLDRFGRRFSAAPTRRTEPDR